MKNLKKLKIMIGSLLLLLTSSVVVLYTLSSSIAIKTKGNEKIFNQEVKTVEWCYISGTGVRMRQSPSLKGKIIGYFKDGERVEYIDSRNGWDLVRKRNGTVGYVHGDYLSCGGC